VWCIVGRIAVFNKNSPICNGATEIGGAYLKIDTFRKRDGICLAGHCNRIGSSQRMGCMNSQYEQAQTDAGDKDQQVAGVPREHTRGSSQQKCNTSTEHVPIVHDLARICIHYAPNGCPLMSCANKLYKV
jgi:hypothetical protein